MHFILNFNQIQRLLFQQLWAWYLPSRSHSKIWHLWRTIRFNGSFSQPSITFPIIRKLKKCSMYWFVSIIKVTFLSNYRFAFSNRGLHWKLSTCGQRFVYRIFCFDTRSRLVTVQIFQKMLIISILTDSQSFCSQPLQVGSSRSRSQSGTQHLWSGNQLKSLCFSRLHRNLDSPEIPKKTISIRFVSILKINFTKTTGFISPIRVDNKNFLAAEIFSLEELSNFIPCIGVLTVQNLKKVPFFTNSLSNQTCFPQPLQAQFPPLKTQPQKYHL